MCFYLHLHHLAIDDLEDAVAEHEAHAVCRTVLLRRVGPAQAEADVRRVLLAASDGALRVVDAARLALCVLLDLGVVQLNCLGHDALLLGLHGCRHGLRLRLLGNGRHFERVDVASCVWGCKSLNGTSMLNKFQFF